MHRPVPINLLVCLLALATGLALLRLSDLMTESPAWAGPAADASADTTVVHDFYDALNATLRTGGNADLDGILGAGFVSHLEPPGLPPTRAGLVSRLLALRATFPSVQLQPEEVRAQGEMIVVQVRVEGAPAGTFLGVPLAGDLAAWGTVDVFRVAAGTIAEFWGGRVDVPLLQPLAEAPLDLPSSALQTVSLERIAIDPGGSVAAGSVLGPEVFYVESGRLTVTVAEDAGSAAGGAAELMPGDLVSLPQGAGATLRNDGEIAAVFLAIAVRVPGGPRGTIPPGAAAPATAPLVATPGVIVTDLAARPLIALPSGPARLGLGHATLAPGALLPVSASGAAMFVVEAGSLSLANTAGSIWSRRGADGTISTATGGTLGPGDALLFGPGAVGEALNVGDTPLVLLVVTIVPDSATAGLPVPASRS